MKTEDQKTHTEQTEVDPDEHPYVKLGADEGRIDYPARDSVEGETNFPRGILDD